MSINSSARIVELEAALRECLEALIAFEQTGTRQEYHSEEYDYQPIEEWIVSAITFGDCKRAAAAASKARAVLEEEER